MKSIIAVAILMGVAILSGCATGGDLDPNRAFPAQPEVKTDIKGKLMSQKLQDIPVYVSSRVMYRDASKVMEANEKVKKEGGTFSFTDGIPVLLDPPADVATNGAKMIAGVKTALTEMGFRLVDTPCQECLIVLTDYAEHWYLRPVAFRNEKRLFIFARARIYYGNHQLAVGHSDVTRLWIEGLIQIGPQMDDAIANAGKFALNDVFKALSVNMASWRQRLSSTQ